MDADYDDDYDPADELDPLVRELRNEIIRLQAQLDQLTAATDRQAAEMAVLQAQTAELTRLMDELDARRKRFERLFVVRSLALGAAGAAAANALMWWVF